MIADKVKGNTWEDSKRRASRQKKCALILKDDGQMYSTSFCSSAGSALFCFFAVLCLCITVEMICVTKSSR